MIEDKIIELNEFRENKKRLLGRLLNRSYRYLSEVAAEYLKGKGYADFRVGHIVALVNIELEGTTVNNLALKAGITKQGMSKVVKELSDGEYVFTAKHPSDARSVMVKLTDKGVDALLEWKLCTEHIDRKFTEILGIERLEQIKDILSVLIEHYESSSEHDLDKQIFHTMLFDKQQFS